MVAAAHGTEDGITAALDRQVKMRHDRRQSGHTVGKIARQQLGSERTETETDAFRLAVEAFQQVGQRHAAEVAPPGGDLDTGQHDLAGAARGQRADLGDHSVGGLGTYRSPRGGNGAVTAPALTAVLNLDIGAGARCFGDGHRLKVCPCQIGDMTFCRMLRRFVTFGGGFRKACRFANICLLYWRGFDRLPGLLRFSFGQKPQCFGRDSHLAVGADDIGDAGDTRHGLRVVLCGTAHDHHDGIGVGVDGAADKLPRFAVGFGGEGAGVDDIDVADIGKRTDDKAKAFKRLRDGFGLIL